MRCSIALLLTLVVLNIAAAQVIPTTEQRQTAAIVEKLFIGASENIKAEIADLRRQLARCDGPANQRLTSDSCSGRTLLQAKLNYLLRLSMDFGDPDNAGAPPAPLTRPTDTANYENLRSFLAQQVRQDGPDSTYVLSENRAKLAIIDHCKAMKDLYYLSVAFFTPEEMQALQGPAGAAKTKAGVNACISEYDANAISANRKAAIEYCAQSTNYATEGRTRFDPCMNRHDMLQAMCKRQLELQEAYSRRRNPQQQHAPQTCPGVQPSQREIQAILAAPAARTMAELPARFFAPPDVVIPPRPPLPIPSGTVLETRLQGGLDGLKVEIGSTTTAILDQPFVADGQTVIPAPTMVFLKTRILGLGPRPDTLQIGLTTEEVQLAPGKFADLKSNELVFTVPNRATAQAPGIQFDTKLRFTIGTGGRS
jgi:hypothetical protein